MQGGAEPEILQGAENVLEDIRKISISTGPERFGKSTASECRNLLDSHGFTSKHHGGIVYGRKKKVRKK